MVAIDLLPKHWVKSDTTLTGLLAILAPCYDACMPAKWTTSHTFQIIIGAAMAVLAFLAKDPTYGPWAAPVLAVLAAIQGALGITSGKGVGSAAPLAAVAFVVGFASVTTACRAEAPLVDLGMCIASDAIKGVPIPTIVTDCSTDLATVVAALLGSKDPQVMASPAHAEAVATHPAGK